MAEAVVEFDYDAEQEDELTLRVGSVIKNVITAEGGWWEGELNGKKGMFPENFVKLRQPVKKEEKREATQRKSVRELANKFKDGSVPLGGPLPQKKKAAEVKAKKCKVLFDYKPENEDELELAVGTLVDFHREVEEGWWEGSVNGRTGVFPSNFVDMVEDGDLEQPNDEKNAAGDKDELFTEIKGKKVMGVGLGNIFGGGPIKLRNTNKKQGAKTEEKEAAKPKLPESQAPDAAKRDKQAGERAIVRFSYVAEQPDELSLKEGEVIRVLDQNLEDEGWWKGEVNGKVGVFPDNFVELLPQEEPVKAPKKPPPPVVKNLYPKLPDKAPVEEKPSVTKKEQEPAPDKSASAAGLKKPVPPPPVGRKPGVPGAALKPPEASTKPEPPKPDPPKVTETAKVEMRSKDFVKGSGSVENNHHPAAATENDKSEGEETSFDVLETSSQKLMHLTANRAKGPKKRPPSTVLAPGDIDKTIEEEVPVTGNNHVHHEKPPTKEQKHTSAESERSSYRRHASHDSVAPPRPPEPVRHNEPHPEVSANTAGLARLVEDLQREVRDLRSHTVGKNEYNELRSDYLRLKQDFENFRATSLKKLRELMMEVDDEKKLRLNTQVEMERVKKLLAESHV